MSADVPNRSLQPEAIAQVIERIPRSDDGAISIGELCDDSVSKDCAMGIISVLRVFDAISLVETENDLRVKACSQIGYYFLRSLAQFIRKGNSLTTNWEREGINQNTSITQSLASGPQLLSVMERIRTEIHRDTTPIRSVAVSQAIIKTRLRGQRQSAYLVQYDSKAHQFQLIGGRQRRGENDPKTVMAREIAEELHENHLHYPQDYDLVLLASDLDLSSLSPTFGAFSAYKFTIYQAVFKRSTLVLGHTDRWVSLKELLAGKTKDGRRIASEIIQKVDELLPGGIEGLKFSLPESQGQSLTAVIRQRKWEIAGLLIGIVGLIVAVIQLLLS